MTVEHADLISNADQCVSHLRFGNFSIGAIPLCLIYSQNTEVLDAWPPAITDFCSLKYCPTPTMRRRKASLKRSLLFLFFFHSESKKWSQSEAGFQQPLLSQKQSDWHQSPTKTCLRTLEPVQGTLWAYSGALGDMSHIKNTQLSSYGCGRQ